MTKQQYIEYLVATPNNYTCTHLADHLEGEAATSHDSISDYLRRYPVLVAETGQEILGYASLSQWYDTPVYAHTAESSLYLAPNAQGRGLGTTLMRALLAEARRLGHHVVLSRIWSENLPSIAMCRKCGYETVGVQREIGFRRGKWEDCVVMQVIL